jgi:hypothetical protein
MKKLLILSLIGVLIIVSLALCATTAYFYYQNEQNKEKTSEDDTDHTEEAADDESSDDTEESSLNFIDPNEYSNKVKLVESDNYIVWMVDPVGIIEDEISDASGSLLIEYKSIDAQENSIKILGSFDVEGVTEIAKEVADDYLIVTSGFSAIRNGAIIDLQNAKLNGEVCRTGDVFYDGDYIYFDNCDLHDNRPWSAGESASVVRMDLSSGSSEKLFTSDDLKHFAIEKIEDNKLVVTQISVISEEDWADPDSFIESTVSYDL